MLVKTKICFSNAIYEGKRRAIAKVKNASGMEMLQMVLIIGIAVVIAGGLFVFLKAYMPGFWDNIKAKLDGIFSSESDIVNKTPSSNFTPNT